MERFRRNDITTKVRFHHDDMAMFSFQHLFTIGSSLVHHVSSLPLHVPSLPNHVPSLPYYVSSLSYHAISLIHHCLIISYFPHPDRTADLTRLFLLQQARLSMQKRLFVSPAQKPPFFCTVEDRWSKEVKKI